MKWSWMLAGALVLAGCGQAVQEAGDTAEPGMVAEDAARSAEPGAGESASEAPGTPPSRPQTDYAALSGYDSNWFVSEGWPGEYPPGFVVLDANIRAPARARPNPGDPQDVSCLLPQYANYQIWNAARVDGDNLDFFVATKKFPVTILEDADVEFIAPQGIETLSLRTGDRLTYLRYLGEGFMVLSYDEREFQINESELREISDIGAIQNQEHLWVRVACLGGRQAWLMFDEVVQEEGIYPSPITGYRSAEDVDPDDVETVRAMMSSDMFSLPPGGAVIVPPPPE